MSDVPQNPVEQIVHGDGPYKETMTAAGFIFAGTDREEAAKAMTAFLADLEQLAQKHKVTLALPSGLKFRDIVEVILGGPPSLKLDVPFAATSERPVEAVDLPESMYPVMIRAFRTDNREQVWDAVLTEPPGVIEVPPLGKIHGCKIDVEVEFGDGTKQMLPESP